MEKKEEKGIKEIVSLAVVYAVTRIRTWVVAATTRSTNHYTITARTLTDMRHSIRDFISQSRFLVRLRNIEHFLFCP